MLMRIVFRVVIVSLLAAFSITLSSGADAKGVWRENSPMTSARAKLNATRVGGDIYVAGGAGISGPKSSFDLYDPLGDLWRPLPPMPEGREQFGMAASDNQVFVSGGLAGNGHQGQLSSDLWAYDIRQGGWVQKTPMPRARRGHAMVSYQGKLYVIGGAGADPSRIMVYDVAQDQWSTLSATLAVPRSNFAAVVAGDSIYTIGGVSLSGKQLSLAERFDLKTGKWKKLASLADGRSGLVAGVLNGKVHVAGGATLLPSKTFVDHYSYDAASNSWKNEPRLLTPRHSMAAETAGGRWYLIGGGSGSGFFTVFTEADVVEVFDPR
jgi:N-acetylneuraminic acid mutarotase